MLLSENMNHVVLEYIISIFSTRRFGLTKGWELDRSQRETVFLLKRYICIYLCHENCKKLTLATIGKYFAGNHSMVLHAVGNIKKELQYNTDLQKDINDFQQKINNKIAALLNDTNQEQPKYYNINLNDFHSLSVAGNRFILAVGFNDDQVAQISQLFNVIESRTHKDTGLYYIEERKKPTEENGNDSE